MKHKLSHVQSGLLPHPVIIAPYHPDWPRIAEEAAYTLCLALKTNIIRIEHIGSTSVPGLAAKPIIDLLPIVNDIGMLDAQKKEVIKLGYLWHDEFGIAGRRFCTFTNEHGVRLIHLHFYQQGNMHIERHLAFRDYLLAHPAVAQQYQHEKLRAAALHPSDSLAYNDEKNNWIKHHEQEALRWYKTK